MTREPPDFPEDEDDAPLAPELPPLELRRSEEPSGAVPAGSARPASRDPPDVFSLKPICSSSRFWAVKNTCEHSSRTCSFRTSATPSIFSVMCSTQSGRRDIAIDIILRNRLISVNVRSVIFTVSGEKILATTSIVVEGNDTNRSARCVTSTVPSGCLAKLICRNTSDLASIGLVKSWLLYKPSQVTRFFSPPTCRTSRVPTEPSPV